MTSSARLLLVCAAIAAAAASGCDYGSVPSADGGGGGSPGGDDDGDDGGDGGDTGDDGGGGGGRYHPANFADPSVHGPELTGQRQDCRSCHGEDLTGGAGPSCDGCHTPSEPQAWRTDCTFCHGGGDNQTGAPPRNLDGSGGPGSFPAHTAHVTDGIAPASECVQCHVKAVDVLSPGHVFDETPGAAEVDLGGGSSPRGEYDGATCTNAYCHGSGRGDDGTVDKDGGPLGCTGCHAGMTSPGAAIGAMSGLHQLHIGEDGITCGDCHRGVTTDGASIADRALHVNGSADLAFSASGFDFDRADQSCTGTCHGTGHSGFSWLGGGRFHPAGYAAPGVHGPDMELQRLDCRSCHGADLDGGSGPSCNGCHQPEWRTTCTYCHGGGQNQTGAPPRDLGSSGGSAQSFVAHTRHVTQGAARAFDCNQCHTMPADVLSSGHAFDASAGAAEVRMSGGLSPSGAYDRSGTCTNLYCHGNGRGQNGSATDGAGSLGCTGCHPGAQSGESAWQSMSGEHRKHLGEGMSCQECHSSVTSDGRTIRAPTLHVDGQRQIVFSAGGMSYDPGSKRCSGSCHGEGHSGESW